jgi:hypothetical protein
VEASFLCEEHWQEIGASGGCDVLLKVGLKSEWIDSDRPDNNSGWRSERPSYFSIAGLKSLGYLILRRRRENAGKLLTALGLADGA